VFFQPVPADHRPGCRTGTPARATGLPPAPPAASGGAG